LADHILEPVVREGICTQYSDVLEHAYDIELDEEGYEIEESD
jgi:hypothetical protein